MVMDGDKSFKATQGISLPLLVRDWVLKEYPNKCCYSLREYHDVALDLLGNTQETTVSSVVISPNAKLTSDPNCAYLINISMDRVEALRYYNMPKFAGPDPRTGCVSSTRYDTAELDWRHPLFFTELAKAIGCQCPKTKKLSR